MKRAGRGHHPEGIRNTGEGECAIECPCCPHPGKNLPDDWRDVDDDKKYVLLALFHAHRLSAHILVRFLYELTLAIDANFRLKRKKRNFPDLPLGDGTAYIVKDSPYHDFLRNVPEVEEVRQLLLSRFLVVSF